MRHLPILAANRKLQDCFLPAVFPSLQLDRVIAHFLRPHRIAAAIFTAVAMGTCCGQAHAHQAAALHSVDDHPAEPISEFIAEASRRFDIPSQWISAIMSAESAGNERAVSSKGAMGLMQIMPETWADLRSRYHLGIDPYDAHNNIIAGTAYLLELRDRYGIPGFLAAYNAGPARWEDHLATGKPLPLETQDFLTKLAPTTGGTGKGDGVFRASIAPSWAAAPLFPTRETASTVVNRAASDVLALHTRNGASAHDSADLAPQSNALFVDLKSSGLTQ